MSNIDHELRRIETMKDAEHALAKAEAFILIVEFDGEYHRVALYTEGLLLHAEETMAQLRRDYCGEIADEPEGLD